MQRISLKQKDYSILTQDDALKLAMHAAISSREVQKEKVEQYYEKVVMDEMTPVYFLYLLENAVSEEAYKNTIHEIRKNFGTFT